MRQIVYRLNDAGLHEFGKWIQLLREGSCAPVPLGLLGDQAYSEQPEFFARIEQQKFATRYDMGVYLVDALKSADDQAIGRDVGLWSWLALFYFDQLCPADSDGHRAPRMRYTYILSSDFRHHPRHAIRTTWDMVGKFGESVRFMFSKGLYERGEIIEQIAARQEFFTCNSVINAASLLYNDAARETFKRGAAGRGQGSINRYIKVLQQFQLTYDLYSLSGEQLFGLLPKEFDRFRAASI